MEIEYIYGLPFVSVTNERMTCMIIGEVVEDLLKIKIEKDIRYPYDEAINNACNILNKLPKDKNVYEWIKENSK